MRTCLCAQAIPLQCCWSCGGAASSVSGKKLWRKQRAATRLVRPALDVRHLPNASKPLLDADQHPNVTLTPPRSAGRGLERRAGTGSRPHPATTPSDCPSGCPRALEKEVRCTGLHWLCFHAARNLTGRGGCRELTSRLPWTRTKKKRKRGSKLEATGHNILIGTVPQTFARFRSLVIVVRGACTVSS